MLDWTWIDDDTCIFTVNGEEVARCNDEDFDYMLNKLLARYSTRR